MMTMDVASLQSDPRKFRQSLLIDADGSPMPLGDVLDDWQQEDFRALDEGWVRVLHPGKPFYGRSRAWLERPRGHSKTADLAIMATWVLFASRRQLRGVAAAGDRDQAALLKDSIQSLLRLNPWLSRFVEVQSDKALNPHTGSSLQIITSDVATSYGLLVDFIIADEVTHWQRRELWDSLLSSAAKRRHCLMVCISNAGFCDSWQWEVREKIRFDEGWHFRRLDGPRASWITADRLREQERLLPSIAYRRLWLNEWSEGSGDALESSWIDRAVCLPCIPGPCKGFVHLCGIDLSVSGDATAVVTLGKSTGWTEHKSGPDTMPVSRPLRAMIDLGMLDAPERETESIYHRGDGRIRLCGVRVWRPEGGSKVPLEQVEDEIVRLHSIYRLAGVAADPYQAAYLCERLRKRNIPIRMVSPSGNILKEMAMLTIETFRESRIELFDCPLVEDLRALRVVEKSYGYRLESPRRTDGKGTKHGDTASALQLALYLARRARPATAAAGRSLVYN